LICLMSCCNQYPLCYYIQSEWIVVLC